MKAILVIDMPDCCNNCPCYDGMEDRSCCNVLDEDMCFASLGRLGNCPLKPMPKKKLVLEHRIGNQIVNRYELTEAKGYNNCLDEILGETE